MKKILIIYGTAGEGHKRAAFAVKAAFDARGESQDDVRLVDALDYTNPFFKWSYPRIYIFMVTYIPSIWGFFYYLFDVRWIYPIVKAMRRFGNKRNTRTFEKFLCDFKPDAVIATHFLASEVISDLKTRGLLETRLITVVTDFRMHSFWYAANTDHYCIGFEESRRELIKKWGIAPEKVTVTGIPVHPKFYGVSDKAAIIERLGLAKDRVKVLLTGGGFGVGPIMKIVRSLAAGTEKLQVLVVCGHNDKLKTEMETFLKGRAPSPVTFTVFGFVNFIDELMSVADISVTKAGGLICSEAIAKVLPLIIIAPIPGQEGRNCKILVANKAAFKITRPAQAKKIIDRIQAETGLLEGMRGHIRAMKKGDP
ncbi:MAG: glycosyltransferase, partial [Candidatus Omnitrophota bacterium]